MPRRRRVKDYKVASVAESSNSEVSEEVTAPVAMTCDRVDQVIARLEETPDEDKPCVTIDSDKLVSLDIADNGKGEAGSFYMKRREEANAEEVPLVSQSVAEDFDKLDEHTAASDGDEMLDTSSTVSSSVSKSSGSSHLVSESYGLYNFVKRKFNIDEPNDFSEPEKPPIYDFGRGNDDFLFLNDAEAGGGSEEEQNAAKSMPLFDLKYHPSTSTEAPEKHFTINRMTNSGACLETIKKPIKAVTAQQQLLPGVYFEQSEHQVRNYSDAEAFESKIERLNSAVAGPKKPVFFGPKRNRGRPRKNSVKYKVVQKKRVPKRRGRRRNHPFKLEESVRNVERSLTETGSDTIALHVSTDVPEMDKSCAKITESQGVSVPKYLLHQRLTRASHNKMERERRYLISYYINKLYDESLGARRDKVTVMEASNDFVESIFSQLSDEDAQLVKSKYRVEVGDPMNATWALDTDDFLSSLLPAKNSQSESAVILKQPIKAEQPDEASKEKGEVTSVEEPQEKKTDASQEAGTSEDCKRDC